MNILLLTDGIYPYVTGGMQKHSYYLAKYLAANKVKVHLVHCVYHDQLPENNGLTDALFTKEEQAYITMKCYAFPKAGKLPGHYVKESKLYAAKIYKDLKDECGKYDLIYAKGFTGAEFIKAKKIGKIKAPILVKFHGFEMFQKAPSFKVKLEHWLLRKLTRWNTLNADYVMSYGGKITDIIHSLGVDRKKILEIPTGIEAGMIETNPTATGSVRKFVFVGRYERRKGIEELNKALKHLLQKGQQNFEFHFIGPIPEDKKIRSANIIYHGEIKEKEKVKTILQTCDVLVCPSHSEGMPNVILEGMAYGLAIIATDVGAVNVMINNNGWLLNSSDPLLISKAIQEALSIPAEQLVSYKKQSIDLATKKFAWENVIQNTIRKFEAVII